MIRPVVTFVYLKQTHLSRFSFEIHSLLSVLVLHLNYLSDLFLMYVKCAHTVLEYVKIHQEAVSFIN